MAGERATLASVREIFDTDLADASLTAFITAAHLFVNARLSGSSLGEPTLTEIERYVAAHLACTRDPRAHGERRGDASVDYQNADGSDLGLNATDYGRIAVMLDSSGALATAADRPASFDVIDPVLEASS